MDVNEVFSSTLSLDNEPILASIVEEDEDQSDEDRLELEVTKQRIKVDRSQFSQDSDQHSRGYTVRRKEPKAINSMKEIFDNERSNSITVSDVTYKEKRKLSRTQQQPVQVHRRCL